MADTYEGEGAVEILEQLAEEAREGKVKIRIEDVELLAVDSSGIPQEGSLKVVIRGAKI